MQKRNNFFLHLVLFLIYSFFSFSIYAQNSNTSVITIESAERSEYRKNAETGDDEIVLSGSVKVSVTKGSTTVRIEANDVTYNRKTEMLFANGNVIIKQTGSTAGEQNLQATTVLLNSSTLEGIFDNGKAIQTKSDAINLPSDSTLIVASEIFGRDSSGTISFKNADLTFCDEDNPHWKIKASNIWLLPGGEFAFFNAGIFVGRIPVFYLPGFYYPKDELIFNPSFGYDARKGYYFQTTTYLYGRKPLDTSSSSKSSSDEEDITEGIFNFIKTGSLKKQKREGFVLHNLEEDYTGDSSKHLKVMVDMYSNLGAMVGLDGVFNPKKIFSNLSANFYMGFSNSIDRNGDGYVPYFDSGKTYYDTSNLMGFELPFRYSGDLELSLSKPFSISVSIPFYSDPYFKDDFSERMESIDWIGYFLNHDKADEDTTASTVSSFEWSGKASYSIPFPSAFKNYMSVSLTANSIFTFSAKQTVFPSEYSTDEKELLEYEKLGIDSGDFYSWANSTPLRSFYYPSQINPLKATASISGTLISINSSSSSSSKSNKSKAVQFDVPLQKPVEIMTETEREEYEKKLAEKNNDENAAEKNDKAAEETKEEKSDTDETLAGLTNPILETSVSSSSSSSGPITYSLTYSITPQITTQVNIDSASFKRPSDFDINNFEANYKSKYWQASVPASLTSKLTLFSSFLSMNNSLNYSGSWQRHPMLNNDYYVLDSNGEKQTNAYEQYDLNKEGLNLLRSDFNAQKSDLTSTNSISLKPFINTNIFKNTSFDYNLGGKILKTKFLGDLEDTAWAYTDDMSFWEYSVIGRDSNDDDDDKDNDWDDFITSHSLSATFSAVEPNFSQVFTISTKLWPMKESYSGSLSLVFPYVTSSFSSGLSQKEKDSDHFIWDPLQSSVSIKILDASISGSYSVRFEDTENELFTEDNRIHSDSARISFSWNNFSASVNWSYTTDYEFTNSKWVAKADKEFIMQSLNISWSTKTKTFYKWKNRITYAPSLRANFVYDFIRPTSSYLSFSPSLTFKIFEFFDLSFNLESKNTAVFRYMQQYSDLDIKIPGEENPFRDLIKSFGFWGDDSFWYSEDARRSSGFKMKSVGISLTHNLCDWDMIASLKISPRTVSENGKKKVYYDPYITFAVSWRPMGSMKTKILDEYGEWKLD